MARSRLFLVVALALLPLASPAADKGVPADPARREALADMLLQLEQLQAELRELRGKVEVQTHEIEVLKARQRDLLADIDRRLSEVERRGTAPAPAEGAAKPGTAPVAETGAPAAPTEAMIASLAKEQQEYDAALALLRQGQYDRAGKRFREFIKAHPKSPLAGPAQYWVGESAYVVRNFKQALVEFSKAMQDYPDSPKVSAALLKIGHTYYELADWGKARETLNQVVARYPNTQEARLAEQRLAKMKKEGR